MPNVPMHWLAEHVAVPAGTTVEELAAALVQVGLEEEDIHTSGVTGPLVVGRVLSLIKEEQKNGKTINYCRVNVGPEHNDAPGEGKEPADVASRGIICGAHNFVEGDSVLVSLPGAVLPGPFPISARKTYGHISDGMICSAKELGLGEDHEGIIVVRDYLGVSEDEVPAPGTDAIELLGLGEDVLEINVTPDRGYCFSMRGVAREYSLSTGAAFTDPGLPENLPSAPPAATADGFAVQVRDEAPIHDQVGCDRFVTRIVRSVNPAAPTPRWLATRLRQAGMRPISLTVDITNYVMLDLGQPLHAYDLHEVTEPIVVRRATAGEQLTTLDDAERALHPQDLLITDSPGDARGSRILGLAGVMGGASSEITERSTDVLVEAAHFDPVSIARTARRHKLPSEAAKRFERGVDTRLAPVAAQRVVDLLVEYGGGTADGAVFDLDQTQDPAPISLDPRLPGRLVGVDYTSERVRGLLQDIGARVQDGADGTWQVYPPTWRPDLSEPEDLVEEVARLDGYDAIPSLLPTAQAGVGLTPAQRRRRDIERTCAELGLVQVLSYPFISPAVFEDLGYPEEDQRRHALRLVNPLADDHPLMRTDLLSTLLATARRNVSRGSGPLGIYEVGLVTRPVGTTPARTPSTGQLPTPEELAALHAAVPHQPRHLAAVLGGSLTEATVWGEARTADWADAIEIGRAIARTVGLQLDAVADHRAPWHPGRCAQLRVAGQQVGFAGELHPQVVARLGLPARSVAIELDLDALLALVADVPPSIDPVSTFPAAKEDIALVVRDDITAAEVLDAVREAAGDVTEDVRLFDVYSGAPLEEGTRSLAFALRMRAPDRTLTAEETAQVRSRVVALAGERYGAKLRG